MKVLFLNYSECSMFFVGGLLEKNGFKNVELEGCNGETRSEMKSKNLDLVIVNVGESEKEVQKISEIRKCRTTTPILAVVGKNNGVGKKCTDHGATDYIYTPIESDAFVEKVRGCLTNKNKKN